MKYQLYRNRGRQVRFFLAKINKSVLLSHVKDLLRCFDCRRLRVLHARCLGRRQGFAHERAL